MILKQTNPNLLTTNDKGIFKALAATKEIEWLTDNDAFNLDIEYYLQHSGLKTISILYDSLLKAEESNVIGSALDKLVSIIILKYKDSWNKLYNSLFADYNPIENYSMVENENIGSKVTSTTSTNQKQFGFNNIEGSDSTSDTGTATTQGDYNDNHRQLTRSGNIGVTTSQQMIESEIELRKKNLYNIIFDDVDSIVTNLNY